MSDVDALVEHVSAEGQTLAIIVRAEFRRPGIHFFTEDDLSQQLAYIRHPAHTTIAAHFHNPVSREVHHTQEVLLLRTGRLRVDLYDRAQVYLESRILYAGDVILLISGGHGFEVLEDVEMFEVKQGPHVGEGDKTRFPAVAADKVRLR